MTSYPEPPELQGDCPGGLGWDSCHADDCGVTDLGDGCYFADPHRTAPPGARTDPRGLTPMTDDELHSSFYSAHRYVDRDVLELQNACAPYLDPDALLTPDQIRVRDAGPGLTRED